MTIEYKVTYAAYQGTTLKWTEEVTATLDVKTYNRLLAWKTVREESGVTPNAYQSTIDAVMTAGHTAFTAAKYTTEPLLLGTDLLNGPQIPDHANVATAWFADTHGNATGVQDSGKPTGVSATTSAGQFKTWPTWAPTAHPLKLAIAAMYACATMTSNNVIATRVPLRIEPDNWVDGVYVGSFTKIYAETYPNPSLDPNAPPQLNYYLSWHAEIFFEKLASGMTVQGALNAANKDASDYLGNNHLQMHLRGDPLTTLTDVYLTLGDRTALGIGPDAASGRWYYSAGN